MQKGFGNGVSKRKIDCLEEEREVQVKAATGRVGRIALDPEMEEHLVD